VRAALLTTTSRPPNAETVGRDHRVDRRARAVQQPGDRQADAARAAGDDRPASLQQPVDAGPLLVHGDVSRT
jgi:hypothetical protein